MTDIATKLRARSKDGHSPDFLLDDAADALERQAAELAALKVENEKLREAAADKLMTETLLTGIVPTDRGVEMGLQGGAAQVLAESLAQSFKEGNGINYVEMRFESRHAVPGERFLVTVQRTAGKTPHELRVEAEAQAAALKADGERYRHIRPMFRVFSLHIDGMHSYCPTGELARMKGPSLDAAIDRAIRDSAMQTVSDLSQGQEL